MAWTISAGWPGSDAIGLHLSLQIEEIRRRNAPLWILRCRAVDPIQSCAVGIRQRLEHDRIDHAKHGGIGADAEPERDNGEKRETGAVCECANG